MKIHLNILKFWYLTDFELQLPHSSPYFAATTCTHKHVYSIPNIQNHFPKTTWLKVSNFYF